VEEFKNALAEALGGETPEALPKEQMEEIDAIATRQFRSWDWIYGHSPKTDFASTRKFSCGTVTAKYSLKHGRFTEVAFEGDFIGSKPVTELAESLKGLRPEDLKAVEVSAYFDKMTGSDFLSLFA
jgi:lipoate-protein ligase A